MQDQIDKYIEDHETAWSRTTLASEHSRLRALGGVLNGSPDKVYQHLAALGKAPYTIKTTFIRICALEAWIGKEKKFQDFMKKHGNRFKHAYKKEELDVTYEEAKERITSLPPAVREHAESLLRTGLRISEVGTVKNGRIIGKGGKTRSVYGNFAGSVSQSVLRKQLRGVGLKPHTLRKLCATRLAEAGATPADLCKVFGWASIGTAYQYLQAKDDDRLQELVDKANERHPLEEVKKGS
jgi:integrase